ncbi:MAG: 23S rRNA (adenine(2030)-N(6))-methyltransferase RlmJ [Isosphaeraceae bacterium]
MRIISGQRRGHKIEGPPERETRPTSDLARESIFNLVGDAAIGMTAIDLFAGTGALGLEALSRGADRAHFVEIRGEAVGLIYRNLATLRYEDRARVHRADAYRWCRSFEPEPGRPCLVFIDPPYAEYDNHPDRMTRLLESLMEKLPGGSMIVLEASKHSRPDFLPEPGRWDRRQYGGSLVAVLEIGGGAGGEDEQSP